MSNNKKWNKLKARIRIGEEVEATVFRVEPYGVFANVGFQVEDGYKYSGIIDIALVPKPGIQPLPREQEEWPKVGDQITCVVLAYRERSYEVDLGIKI